MRSVFKKGTFSSRIYVKSTNNTNMNALTFCIFYNHWANSTISTLLDNILLVVFCFLPVSLV